MMRCRRLTLMMMQAWSTLALAFILPHEYEGVCRSNSTHVAWRSGESTASVHQRRSLQNDCWYQSRKDAERDCFHFLANNIMPFDYPQKETLGFDSDESDDVDGLSNGLIGPTITLALDAKQKYEWTDSLPQSVFYEYVLNYANANEARNNWRPLLTKVVEPMVENCTDIQDVVRVVNTHLWKALSTRYNESIEFQSGQTPLIFDPMSVIAFGYASCTGLAILFVDALRAAGAPARLAGTPAWWRNRDKGNHNWVEVWNGDPWFFDGADGWSFLEPTVSDAAIVDTLERDPCQRWFCHADRFPGTEVYAARLDRSRATTHYPMAWEWNNKDVPGVNRTDYYTKVCSKCK